MHNAFNPALISELRMVFDEIASQGTSQVRVVVLAGAGKSFCAGADVNWMQSLAYSEDENVADALEWPACSTLSTPARFLSSEESTVLRSVAEWALLRFVMW